MCLCFRQTSMAATATDGNLKLMDPPSANSPITDWTQCALCQCNTKEKLQCPAKNSKESTTGSTYNMLADNLSKFAALGCFMPLDLSRLDEGCGIEKTFVNNVAKFHPSCRYKFNNTQLKRKLASMQSDPGPDSAKDAENNDSMQPPAKSLKRRSSCDKPIEHVCFLCDKPAPLTELRNASTFKLDAKVRQCACDLQDSSLLAKLSSGDLMSQEAKYHLSCLSALYRKARQKDENIAAADQNVHRLLGLAFAEVAEYIEEKRLLDDESSHRDKMTVFKLADVTTLYHDRLLTMGLSIDKVHSTRLKTRLLNRFPDMKAFQQGRDILLGFDSHLGSAMKNAFTEDFDDEAVHLARAAHIVRRDIFKLTGNLFSGTFDKSCQFDSVPESLQALVKMILQGPSVKNATSSKNQAAVSIARLIRFNCVKHAKQGSTSTRHLKEMETPLPLYIGLSVHAHTRKRELVDTLFSLGLSVSYSRVLDISSEMAQKACKQFEQENVVCPLKLKSNLFTTGAIDNIDYNPSSSTSRDSFHGTSLSLFQHPLRNTEAVERQPPEQMDGVASKSVPQLPVFYREVPPVCMKTPVALPADQPPIPVEPENTAIFTSAFHAEQTWLQHVKNTGIIIHI